MKKQPIYLSFATQKGGAGKTAFTTLTASLLHYKMGYNVAVIDCDYPQSSIVRMRERDLQQVKEVDYYKALAYKQFTSLQKKMYPVVGCDVKSALQETENLIARSEADIDIVLFDMPGTVNQEGAIKLLANMHYIFCPLTSDRSVVVSSVDFIVKIKQLIMDGGIGSLQKVFMFWNEVDAREKTRVYEMCEKLLAKFQLPVLETKIPYLLRFRKEITDTTDIFRCTVFPASPNLLRESRVDLFVGEICSKIK